MDARAWLFGAVLLAVAGPAGASVKDGVDAWARGDYARALAEWRGPAAAGDPDAEFNLAQAYKLGKGVPADLRQAEALYLKAAQQGHLPAADTYGLLLFQRGRRGEAMAWLVPSAERGEPRAQYVLGIAHFNGDLVTRDTVRAYALMIRAAAAGLETAKATLGSMDETLPLAERWTCGAERSRTSVSALRWMASFWKLRTKSGPGAPQPNTSICWLTPAARRPRIKPS